LSADYTDYTDLQGLGKEKSRSQKGSRRQLGHAERYSLECCDLSQLFNIEWLSTKSGAEPPHSKGLPFSDGILDS